MLPYSTCTERLFLKFTMGYCRNVWTYSSSMGITVGIQLTPLVLVLVNVDIQYVIVYCTFDTSHTYFVTYFLCRNAFKTACFAMKFPKHFPSMMQAYLLSIRVCCNYNITVGAEYSNSLETNTSVNFRVNDFDVVYHFCHAVLF